MKLKRNRDLDQSSALQKSCPSLEILNKKLSLSLVASWNLEILIIPFVSHFAFKYNCSYLMNKLIACHTFANGSNDINDNAPSFNGCVQLQRCHVRIRNIIPGPLHPLYYWMETIVNHLVSLLSTQVLMSLNNLSECLAEKQ